MAPLIITVPDTFERCAKDNNQLVIDLLRKKVAQQEAIIFALTQENEVLKITISHRPMVRSELCDCLTIAPGKTIEVDKEGYCVKCGRRMR